MTREVTGLFFILSVEDIMSSLRAGPLYYNGSRWGRSENRDSISVSPGPEAQRKHIIINVCTQLDFFSPGGGEGICIDCGCLAFERMLGGLMTGDIPRRMSLTSRNPL